MKDSRLYTQNFTSADWGKFVELCLLERSMKECAGILQQTNLG